MSRLSTAGIDQKIWRQLSTLLIVLSRFRITDWIVARYQDKRAKGFVVLIWSVEVWEDGKTKKQKAGSLLSKYLSEKIMRLLRSPQLCIPFLSLNSYYQLKEDEGHMGSDSFDLYCSFNSDCSIPDLIPNFLIYRSGSAHDQGQDSKHFAPSCWKVSRSLPMALTESPSGLRIMALSTNIIETT